MPARNNSRDVINSPGRTFGEAVGIATDMRIFFRESVAPLLVFQQSDPPGKRGVTEGRVWGKKDQNCLARPAIILYNPISR